MWQLPPDAADAAIANLTVHRRWEGSEKLWRSRARSSFRAEKPVLWGLYRKSRVSRTLAWPSLDFSWPFAFDPLEPRRSDGIAKVKIGAGISSRPPHMRRPHSRKLTNEIYTSSPVQLGPRQFLLAQLMICASTHDFLRINRHSARHSIVPKEWAGYEHALWSHLFCRLAPLSHVM